MTEWCSNNLWGMLLLESRMRVHEAKGSTKHQGSTKQRRLQVPEDPLPPAPTQKNPYPNNRPNSSTTGAATTSSSLSWLDEISLASSGGIGTRGAGPVRVSDVIYQKR